MKPYSFILITLFFLFNSCSNPDSPKKDADNGTVVDITEMPLPKGKPVVDYEEGTDVADKTGPTAIGSYDNNTSVKDPASSVVDARKLTEKDLCRRFKDLLIFHADDTMTIKKAYQVTLEMGKDQKLGALKDEVLESANARDDKIHMDTTMEIGSKMRATLMDMSGEVTRGFDIELIGGPEAAEQSISEKRKRAVWNWKLIPLTPGQQELRLAISVIEKNGEKVTLPTRRIPILIYAEKESFLTQVGNFFNDANSKWLITAIVIPILIAWFTTRMRHRHDVARAKAEDKARQQQAAQQQNPEPPKV
ncbi:MAG: hypothetical protein JST86_13930 [Bacteroidetes bacterium]|nr:hypothetical protein [Bacteroidota bacterium]